jgi:hypothetical protein
MLLIGHAQDVTAWVEAAYGSAGLPLRWGVRNDGK